MTATIRIPHIHHHRRRPPARNLVALLPIQPCGATAKHRQALWLPVSHLINTSADCLTRREAKVLELSNAQSGDHKNDCHQSLAGFYEDLIEDDNLKIKWQICISKESTSRTRGHVTSHNIFYGFGNPFDPSVVAIQILVCVNNEIRIHSQSNMGLTMTFIDLSCVYQEVDYATRYIRSDSDQQEKDKCDAIVADLVRRLDHMYLICKQVPITNKGRLDLEYDEDIVAEFQKQFDEGVASEKGCKSIPGQSFRT